MAADAEPGPMPDMARLEDLVLVRLAVPAKTSPTLAQVTKDVVAVAGAVGAAASSAVLAAVSRAEAAGLAAVERKGKTARAAITPAGRRRALDVLGLADLPPRVTWKGLLHPYLTARALGLTSAPTGETLKRLKSKPGFQAAALKVAADLPLDNVPPAPRAVDALGWSLLGIETDKPFSRENVLSALVLRALGEPPIPPKPVKSARAIERLIAHRLEARRESDDGIRAALLQRWMVGGEPEPGSDTAIVESAVVVSSASDLATFARRVIEAARTCPTGRFGSDRVFIAHVHQALRNEPNIDGLSLEAFKARLVEANAARFLDLGRADLVGAMDSEDVRASEVRHHEATFHFIRVPESVS